ncbi:MAG: hypothetical protein AB8I56_10445 [Anaerolineales bacterium]
MVKIIDRTHRFEIMSLMDGIPWTVLRISTQEPPKKEGEKALETRLEPEFSQNLVASNHLFITLVGIYNHRRDGLIRYPC